MRASAALRTIVELVRVDAADPVSGNVTDAAGLAAKLRESGIDAREVSVQSPSDIDHLSTPSALLLNDGSWLVLKRRNLVITADGEERTTAATLYGLGVREVVAREHEAHVQPSIVRFLLGAARAHGRSFAALVAIAFVVRVLFAAVPELTRTVVDRALPDGARNLVGAIAFAIVIVAATQALLQRLRGALLTFIRAATAASAGRGFLRHLIHQPLAAAAGMTRGDLLQSTAGVQLTLDAAFDQVIPALLDAAPAFVVLTLLFQESSLLALVSLIASAAIIGVQLASAARQASLQRAELSLQARHRSLFLEALSGITSIKSLGAEAPIARRWSALQSREVSVSLRRRRTGAIADAVVDAMRQAALAAILVWGAIQAIGGHMSLGSLVATIQLSVMLMASATSFASGAAAVMQVRAQLDRTNHFLRSPRLTGSRTAIDRAAEVVIEDVWFRYAEDAPWILSGYSATIQAGEMLRLSSASGSGKTTLLRLVAGLYEPARGSIRINGIDASRAGGVAYLPQFPHVFGGTLLDNLRIFSGDAPLDRILRIAVETGLDEWVRTMPMAYDTVLATAGANVSGGQRQLITLTAVLASDRPLLLLDEPMANLDRATADRIRRVAARERKTIIYAEHAAAERDAA